MARSVQKTPSPTALRRRCTLAASKLKNPKRSNVIFDLPKSGKDGKDVRVSVPSEKSVKFTSSGKNHNVFIPGCKKSRGHAVKRHTKRAVGKKAHCKKAKPKRHRRAGKCHKRKTRVVKPRARCARRSKPKCPKKKSRIHKKPRGHCGKGKKSVSRRRSIKKSSSCKRARSQPMKRRRTASANKKSATKKSVANKSEGTCEPAKKRGRPVSSRGIAARTIAGNQNAVAPQTPAAIAENHS